MPSVPLIEGKCITHGQQLASNDVFAKVNSKSFTGESHQTQLLARSTTDSALESGVTCLAPRASGPCHVACPMKMALIAGHVKARSVHQESEVSQFTCCPLLRDVRLPVFSVQGLSRGLHFSDSNRRQIKAERTHQLLNVCTNVLALQLWRAQVSFPIMHMDTEYVLAKHWR